MGVAGVGALGFGAWAIVLLASGVVSLLGFASVPTALLSALANGLALEPARKLGEARRRLKEQAFDLGL